MKNRQKTLDGRINIDNLMIDRPNRHTSTNNYMYNNRTISAI